MKRSKPEYRVGTQYSDDRYAKLSDAIAVARNVARETGADVRILYADGRTASVVTPRGKVSQDA